MPGKKKTVFLNGEREPIRTVRQMDVSQLKAAFRVVMKDYLRMKQQQARFEDSLEKFCLKISPWSIPHRTMQAWLKEFRG